MAANYHSKSWISDMRDSRCKKASWSANDHYFGTLNRIASFGSCASQPAVNSFDLVFWH